MNNKNFFTGEINVEKGIGLPRYTTAQRLAFTPSTDGYLIYDTDLKQAQVWSGSNWKQIGTGTSHSTLSDLTNDDHIQYLNQSRGDARYYTKTEIDTTTWDTSKIVGGTFNNALISSNNIKQHETVLNITKSQITDFVAGDYATAAQGTLADSALQTLSTNSIMDLGDVSGTPTNNQILTYNSTAGSWEPKGVPDGITDHGNLTGLDDDDHPHYLNTSRGDARYLQLSGGTLTGNLVLSKAAPRLHISSTDASDPMLVLADNGVRRGLAYWSKSTGRLAFTVFNDTGSASIATLYISENGFIYSTVDHRGVDGTSGSSFTTQNYVTNAIANHVSDHGGMTGLDGDDHPQYLNNARGDVRYYTKSSASSYLVSLNDAQTITGNKTFNGDSKFNGPFIVYSTDVQFHHNLLRLNYGVSGTPATDAGLEVERGNQTNSRLLWNESTDTWQAGIHGNLYDISLSNHTHSNYVPNTGTSTIAGTKTFSSATYGVSSTASSSFTTRGYVDGAFVKDTGNQAIAGIKTFSNETRGVDSSTSSSFTTRGYVDGAFVKDTGNQTIAGTKTFSSATYGVSSTASSSFTTRGYVDGAFVKDTGDQTITGIKTFSHETRGVDSTTSNSFSTRSYVDGKVSKSGDWMSANLSFRLPAETGAMSQGIDFREVASLNASKFGGVAGCQLSGGSMTKYTSLYYSVGSAITSELRIYQSNMVFDTDSMDFDASEVKFTSTATTTISFDAGSAQNVDMNYNHGGTKRNKIFSSASELAMAHYHTDGTTTLAAISLSDDIVFTRSGMAHSTFSRFGNSHKFIIEPGATSGGSGNANGSEIELQSYNGSNTYSARIASSSSLSDNYTLILPNSKPSAGKQLEVQSVSSQSVVLAWV